MMSVWDKVDRATFEEDLITLHNISPIQNPAKLPALVPPTCEDRSIWVQKDAIDDITEHQLAEDFAFLTSLTTWAHDVAAATVHHEHEPDRLCVTIAVNEGVGLEAKRFLETLIGVLKQRANGRSTSRDTEANCLDAVVVAHRNRILARMGSRKAPREKFPVDFNLAGRVKALSSTIRQTPNSPWPSDNPSLLIEQLEAFESSVRSVEGAARNSLEEHESVKSLLRAALVLTASNQPLVQRVQKAGVKGVNQRSKEIRALNGLATYVRICEYVTRAARSHKKWFRNIELNVIEANLPTMWQGKKLFVHAEIQLLVHFELFCADVPRFIGASKKPCFLCHSFVRAHGKYGMRQSHGEVFRQWTVPDRPDFSRESRERLAEALQRTAQNIKNALKAPRLAQIGKLWFHPCQTTSKLLLDQLRNSSKSTIVSVVSVTSAEGERKAAPPSIDSKVNGVFSKEEEEEMRQSSEPEKPCALRDMKVLEEIITAATSSTYRDDKVELFFEFEPASIPENDDGVAAVKTQTGLCRVRGASPSPSVRGEVIDIARLARGVVTLKSERASGPVRFILRLGSANYEVELQWQ